MGTKGLFVCANEYTVFSCVCEFSRITVASLSLSCVCVCVCVFGTAHAQDERPR
jgi:hypothetical protein